MTAEEMNKLLLLQIQSLSDTNASLLQTLDAQTVLITKLNQTIQELKEQINKNSKNSSKPPSSDGLKKPSPKSLRKPSGKKAGGQTGHQGTHLSVMSDPNDIVGHMPSACEGCPHYKMCKGTACVTERRHVIDAVVTVNITEHQLLEIPICMLHGDTRKGIFPSAIKATVQYGENLQALSVALNTVGAVSIKRTHEILSGVFNIPIATGTISNMVKRCASAVTGTVNMIKQKVIDSGLSHFDETGTRVDKKLWWVHDASNCEFTYLDISPKRGYLGMEQCGVLPLFRGIAMHDCWASYWSYTDIQHAVCCAHLLRELTGIIENHPEQKWASAFMDLLLEMKKVKEKAIEVGKESLSYYHYHKFDKLYNKLIKQAREENPLPVSTEKKRGRKKKGKILALVERLDNYKASVCLFIYNFMIPFDNNQAERDIRMIKVKTKVSGCFRSEEGSKDYLKIMSYVGTAHKQGHNAYDAIRKAISGCPEFIFE
ncbi:MAG: IS66 family transposase [Eubacteriales bacterium]